MLLNLLGNKTAFMSFVNKHSEINVLKQGIFSCACLLRRTNIDFALVFFSQYPFLFDLIRFFWIFS